MQTLWRIARTKEYSAPEVRATGVPEPVERVVFAPTFACFATTSVVESSLPRHTTDLPPTTSHPVNIHLYEEEIAGRTYHIEVHARVGRAWRAKLARRPGMPTALMPFYGKTPELAARELTNWLSLVAGGPRPR